MDKKICTIIVPCYNEQDAIPIYYDKMKKDISDLKGIEAFPNQIGRAHV